jgi:hypothetical protein
MVAHIVTATGLAAAGVAIVSPADGGVIWSAVVSYGPIVVTWALAALGLVGAWVLAKLGAAASTRSLFAELALHARDVVVAVTQVYVDQIKRARADGVLTEDEKATARAMAIAALKERLSLRKLVALGGGWLTKLFAGSKWASKVESILGNAIETAVGDSKRTSVALGIATAPAQVMAPSPAPGVSGIPPQAVTPAATPPIAPSGPPVPRSAR